MHRLGKAGEEIWLVQVIAIVADALDVLRAADDVTPQLAGPGEEPDGHGQVLLDELAGTLAVQLPLKWCNVLHTQRLNARDPNLSHLIIRNLQQPLPLPKHPLPRLPEVVHVELERLQGYLWRHGVVEARQEPTVRH